MIKGVIKRAIGEVQIKGYEISPVIIEALLGRGNELIVDPIFDEFKNQIGECIKVYKVD